MRSRGMRKSVILHIPHASREIPPEERAGICLSDAELSQELLCITDAWTNELFPSTPHEFRRVVFPASRLLCDPERFERDEDEPMSRSGMGAVYTRTSHGVVMRNNLTLSERERIIEQWYRPHHEKLTRAVETALGQYGQVLIVDCHSFPSMPLPYETDRSSERPDICLGTDPFHTPDGLLHRAELAAKGEGWTVQVNKPFSGALVPFNCFRKEKQVAAIMIEVNRALYMDERSGERRSTFEGVRMGLTRMLEALVSR